MIMEEKKKNKQYPWPKKTSWGVHWVIENGKWVKKDGPPGIRRGQNFDARDSFLTFAGMAAGFLFFSIASLLIIEDEIPSLVMLGIFLLAAILLGIVAVYAFMSWREDVKYEEEVRKAREEKQRLWRESRKHIKKNRKRK